MAARDEYHAEISRRLREEQQSRNRFTCFSPSGVRADLGEPCVWVDHLKGWWPTRQGPPPQAPNGSGGMSE